MRKLKEEWRVLLLWFLLSLPAWAPLTYPGVLQTWVGLEPVYRLGEFLRSPSPLAWVPRIGAGPYQFWQAEGWLPYALVSALVRAGVAPLASLKLVVALAMLSGSLGTLLLARKVWQDGSRLGPVLASVAYLYSPYVLASAYVRGWMGELLFLGLFPWMALGVANGSLILLALAWTLAFWAQPGLALVATALAVVWVIVGGWREKRRLSFLLGVLGIVAGLLGLLPRWKAHGMGAGVDPSPHAAHLYQLLLPRWGFGFSTPGWNDRMPMQVGAMLLILAMLALYVSRDGDDRRKAWALAGTAVLIALLSLNWLAPLWHALGPRSPLAYPWQMLAFVPLPLALLASKFGGWLESLDGVGVVSGIGAVTMVLLVAYPHLDAGHVRVSPSLQPTALFGDGRMMLAATEVSGKAQPGRSVKVRLVWQCVEPLPKDYNIFLHLLGRGEKMVAQEDELLKDAEGRSTSKWVPGEVVAKEYVLRIPSGAPGGPYRLTVGLYLWQTGERLPVGNDNKVEVDLSHVR